MKFSIYRYDPESGREPYTQDYELKDVPRGMMLLGALVELKKQDETLSFEATPLAIITVPSEPPT